LYAVQRNDVEEVRTLLREDKVPRSYANPVGQSAVHIAAGYGHWESLRLLLLMEEDDKETLSSSSSSSSSSIVSTWTLVNSKNRLSGSTPLHCCLQKRPNGTVDKVRRLACVHLLVQAGADLGVPEGSSGRTPVQYWRDNGYCNDDDDEDHGDDDEDNDVEPMTTVW
jgi:ankyrin repeat protein